MIKISNTDIFFRPKMKNTLVIQYDICITLIVNFHVIAYSSCRFDKCDCRLFTLQYFSNPPVCCSNSHWQNHLAVTKKLLLRNSSQVAGMQTTQKRRREQKLLRMCTHIFAMRVITRFAAIS